MKKFKLQFVLFPLSVFLCSYLGGLFTNFGMNWYKTLNLPSWTPPGSVIGIVWTIIFILLITAMLIVWEKFKNNDQYKGLALLFTISLFLNMWWSYLFFFQQNILGAFIEALLLELSVIAMIIAMWKLSKKAAVLLFPYAAWVAFASFLTYIIYSSN